MDPWQISVTRSQLHSVTLPKRIYGLCLGAEGISRWMRKRPFPLDLQWSRQDESCFQITIIQMRRYYSKCRKRRRDKRVGISDRKGTGAWRQCGEPHKADTQAEPCSRGGSAHVQVVTITSGSGAQIASSYTGHWYLEYILYGNDILSGLGLPGLSSKLI